MLKVYDNKFNIHNLILINNSIINKVFLNYKLLKQ